MSKIIITVLMMHHHQKPLEFSTTTVQCNYLKFYVKVDVQNLGTSVHNLALVYITAHFKCFIFIVYITSSIAESSV
jgi:hypothetical protein